MTKSEVVAFFGGTREHVGIAIGLQANSVRMWPEKLGVQLQDRVIGAAIRTAGVDRTRKAFPDHMKR